MKAIEDTNKWTDFPYSWIEQINTVKMSMLPRTTYRFKANHIKIPMVLFTEIENTILKFVWKHERFQIAKEILRQNNKAGTSLSLN